MSSALDRSLAILQRSLIALALSVAGSALARLGAAIGPYSFEIGFILVFAGVVCLVGAAGALISCAFVGRVYVSPWPQPDDLGATQRARDGAASGEPEACHCMNHLNARAHR